MKLIIDIPDDEYKRIKKYPDFYSGTRFEQIKQGKPLEKEHKEMKKKWQKELEKIKTEFEEDRYILLNQTVAIKIIDKYIAKLKGKQK